MNALQVIGAASVKVQIDTSAASFRDVAVSDSSRITQVTNAGEYGAITATIRNLKALERQVEAARKAVKEEPLRITREIDDTAKSFVAPVTAEVSRLESLANAYAREQARTQAEAEAKARAERQRIEREAEEKRIEAIKAQREAEEKQRREQEEARKVAALAHPEAPAPKANPFADIAAQIKSEQEQERIARETEASKAAALASVIVPVASVATKMVTRWEVLDLVAFAIANPSLVTITPKIREIDREVKAGKVLANLKVWQEVEAKL